MYEKSDFYCAYITWHKPFCSKLFNDKTIKPVKLKKQELIKAPIPGLLILLNMHILTYFNNNIFLT